MNVSFSHFYHIIIVVVDKKIFVVYSECNSNFAFFIYRLDKYKECTPIISTIQETNI